MVTTKKQLDWMASKGCQVPDCSHVGHLDKVYLHARCHTGCGNNVEATPQSTLRFTCYKCERFIVEIGMEEMPKVTSCCDSPVEACYNSLTGKLRLACLLCKAEVAEVAVAS